MDLHNCCEAAAQPPCNAAARVQRCSPRHNHLLHASRAPNCLQARPVHPTGQGAHLPGAAAMAPKAPSPAITLASHSTKPLKDRLEPCPAFPCALSCMESSSAMHVRCGGHCCAPWTHNVIGRGAAEPTAARGLGGRAAWRGARPPCHAASASGVTNQAPRAARQPTRLQHFDGSSDGRQGIAASRQRGRARPAGSSEVCRGHWAGAMACYCACDMRPHAQGGAKPRKPHSPRL